MATNKNITIRLIRRHWATVTNRELRQIRDIPLELSRFDTPQLKGPTIGWAIKRAMEAQRRSLLPCTVGIENAFPAGLGYLMQDTLESHGINCQVKWKKNCRPYCGMTVEKERTCRALLPVERSGALHQIAELVQTLNCERAVVIVESQNKAAKLTEQLLNSSSLPEEIGVVSSLGDRDGGKYFREGEKYVRVVKVAEAKFVPVNCWDMAILVGAAAHTTTALDLMMQMDCTRVCLVRPSERIRANHAVDLATIFGPMFPKSEFEQCYLGCRVDWVFAPLSPAVNAKNVVERLRLQIWKNNDRNELIASIATAIRSQNQAAMEKLGLTNALDYTRREKEQAEVLLLVENNEHAQELSRRLPGWQVANMSGQTDEEIFVSPAAIITLRRAKQTTISPSVVINAAGLEGDWINHIGYVGALNSPDNKCVIVDFVDQGPETQTFRQRVLRYTANGLESSVAAVY